MLRGPSISEIILSPEDIGFSGIENPSVIIALAHEGVDRRKYLFGNLDENTLIIRIKGVDIPDTQATVFDIDLKEQGFKNQDWALASLAVMARLNKVISFDMLNAAIKHVFKDKILESALNLVNRAESKNA